MEISEDGKAIIVNLAHYENKYGTKREKTTAIRMGFAHELQHTAQVNAEQGGGTSFESERGRVQEERREKIKALSKIREGISRRIYGNFRGYTEASLEKQLEKKIKDLEKEIEYKLQTVLYKLD